MPRWTPPPIASSSETSSSCKKQAASSAAVVSDAAQAEGLGGEALSSPGGPPEPAAATPEGRKDAVSHEQDRGSYGVLSLRFLGPFLSP